MILYGIEQHHCKRGNGKWESAPFWTPSYYQMTWIWHKFISLPNYLRFIKRTNAFISCFSNTTQHCVTYKRNINILHGSRFHTKILHYVFLLSLTRAASLTVLPHRRSQRFSIHDHQNLNGFCRWNAVTLPWDAASFAASKLLGATDLLLLQNVQTDSGAHPAFKSIDTGGSDPGVKRLKR